VVESFAVSSAKTKELVGKLKEMGLDHTLIVHDDPDENLYLAARNRLMSLIRQLPTRSAWWVLTRY